MSLLKFCENLAIVGEVLDENDLTKCHDGLASRNANRSGMLAGRGCVR